MTTDWKKKIKNLKKNTATIVYPNVVHGAFRVYIYRINKNGYSIKYSKIDDGVYMVSNYQKYAKPD